MQVAVSITRHNRDRDIPVLVCNVNKENETLFIYPEQKPPYNIGTAGC